MVTWQSEIRTLLKSEMNRGTENSGRPTLRELARKLGLSAATLSRFLSSEDDIAKESALKIVRSLNLTQEKRNFYYILLGEKVDRNQVEIPLDGRFLLEHWLHIAVWVSMDLPKEKRGAASIARRLGVAQVEVEEVIALLVERGFLIATGENVFKKSNQHFKIGNDGRSDSLLQNFHRDGLNSAARALERVPVSRRQFSTVTFTGNAAMLERARAELIELAEKIPVMMDNEAESDEVFRLTLALFPLNFEES